MQLVLYDMREPARPVRLSSSEMVLSEGAGCWDPNPRCLRSHGASSARALAAPPTPYTSTGCPTLLTAMRPAPLKARRSTGLASTKAVCFARLIQQGSFAPACARTASSGYPS